MTMARPTRREDFSIALICALPLEFDAAVLTLDEIWEDDEHHYGKAPGDHNHYTFGRLGRHNVVLLVLPNMGKSSSASACASLRHSFSALSLFVLCGICGGVPNPSPDAHIRLGDIIVAEAIVQYDFGRQYPYGFAPKDTIDDSLGRARREIRSFLVGFKTDHGRRNLERRTATELDGLQAKAVEDGNWSKFTRPSSSDDVLFRADYPHRHEQSSCCSDEAACKEAIETSCEELGCDVDGQQSRVSSEEQPSTPSRSRVFIGKVGSGDTVMKSGEHRDRIAREHDLIGFEMEGAGVWDEMPCLVVKAVCDYADSHKNKKWQAFAAAAAASATKALLGKYDTGSSSVTPLQAAPAFEPPQSGPFFSVPHRQNSEFVDRPDVLGRVRNHFGHETEEPKRARVAIHGLGGVGKTQIALAYCHWFRKRFPEASVFWVYAASVGRFREAYNDIAQLCNIPGRDDPTVDVLPLVKEWLEKNHRGKWLLVIDNADDTEVFFQSPMAGSNFGIQDEAESGGDVGRYVPECAQGSVLITSRNKQAAVRLTYGKQPIEVNKMTDDEAGELLRSILVNHIVSDEDVSLLSSKLEHLPLALAQAASYILESSMSIGEYVSLLDQSDFGVVDRLSEPFETVGRGSETPHALTATWMISFNQIERQHPLAGDVLSFISLLDRQSIPKEFVHMYCREKLDQDSLATSSQDMSSDELALEAGRAIGVLVSFSFISEAAKDAYEMHRLVQLITQKRLTNEGKFKHFARGAIEVVSAVYPQGLMKNRSLCLEYLPHATLVLSRMKDPWEGVRAVSGRLCSDVGRFLLSQGQHEEAERYAERAVELSRAALGLEHADTLEHMLLLARLYTRRGRFKDAEDIALQSIDTSERIFGVKARMTLSGKHILAGVKMKLFRYDEAEQLLRDAWRTSEAEYVGTNFTISCRNSLGKLYIEPRRFAEAEAILLESLEKSRTSLGEEHPEVLLTMRGLADTYCELDRVDDAEELILHVLAAQRRLLGEEHPHTVESSSCLCHIYWEQGRIGECTSLAVRNVDLRRKMWGNKHPRTLTMMHNLACYWGESGRLRDAINMMRECVEGTREVLGERHRHTLDAIHNLAAYLNNSGQHQEAIDMTQDCIEGRREVLGEHHEETLRSIHNLAVCLDDSGQHQDAIAMMRKCLEGRLVVLGEHHKHTLFSAEYLENWEERLGDNGNIEEDRQFDDGASSDSDEYSDAAASL